MEPYGFNLSPIFQFNEANDMSADELLGRHVITRYYIKRYLSIQCLHSCVLHECVCVAVAETVHSGSVAVVSGIYYSNHWWLQADL